MVKLGNVTHDIDATKCTQTEILEYSINDFATFFRVRLHDFEFFIIKFARFAQNVARNADLADVMQWRE